MFFILPLLPFLAIYILAAVLPAVILLRYIYRTDTVEKEPPGLLVLLLLMGVVAALCSGILEGLGETCDIDVEELTISKMNIEPRLGCLNCWKRTRSSAATPWPITAP